MVLLPKPINNTPGHRHKLPRRRPKMLDNKVRRQPKRQVRSPIQIDTPSKRPHRLRTICIKAYKLRSHADAIVKHPMRNSRERMQIHRCILVLWAPHLHSGHPCLAIHQHPVSRIGVRQNRRRPCIPPEVQRSSKPRRQPHRPLRFHSTKVHPRRQKLPRLKVSEAQPQVTLISIQIRYRRRSPILALRDRAIRSRHQPRQANYTCHPHLLHRPVRHHSPLIAAPVLRHLP